MKKTLKAIIIIVCILIAIFIVHEYQKGQQNAPQKEITICSSTVPSQCDTYRCEKGTIVWDMSQNMPGGTFGEKFCSDGNKAETISFERQ